MLEAYFWNHWDFQLKQNLKVVVVRKYGLSIFKQKSEIEDDYQKITIDKTNMFMRVVQFWAVISGEVKIL